MAEMKATLETLESELDRLEATQSLPTVKLSNCPLNLHYVSLDYIKTTLRSRHNGSGSEIVGVDSSSDLVPGIYEGGFKVWESSVDVIELIRSNPELVKDRDVLDMGCGAGLVGIAALIAGARSVTFQDFNREVLRLFTIVNIFINAKAIDGGSDVKALITERCRFASGDWEDLVSLEAFVNCKCDVIFSAETIYSESNYHKITELFKKLLKQQGAAYVAGKTYYFGVGGGMRSFEDHINEQGTLKIVETKIIDAPVLREILTIKSKE
ncbi:Histidine protein methyltransferase 1 -like protein [Halotydeus destructor]|nr:Histidine protein methyltransferase 1 -like protein [Halotydeus destructor]